MAGYCLQIPLAHPLSLAEIQVRRMGMIVRKDKDPVAIKASRVTSSPGRRIGMHFECCFYEHPIEFPQFRHL